jgi:ElaB/YqjD/DUF883 family membrane-anchored ribosome-binding protein
MKPHPEIDPVASLHDEHKRRLENLEKDLQEKKEEVSRLIQQYPITSVLVAFGLGIVLGKLFSGRK